MSYRRFAVRQLVTVSLLGLSLLPMLPHASQALFHVAAINEFMTSYNGDPTVQFVEIRMLAPGQRYVTNSILSTFDASGNYLGDVLIAPNDVPNGNLGDTWLMATAPFATLSGITPDFIIPATLPVGGGMICWGGGPFNPFNFLAVAPNKWNHADPTRHIDCIAYGSYHGPSTVLVGTPTPLDADGHSLQRIAETDNNRADILCSNPATPQTNTPTSASLPATSPCPLCGNSIKEAGEACDGADDALCPGLCQANCKCPDADLDGTPDVSDVCTTLSSTTPPSTPPDQNPEDSVLTFHNLDRLGRHAFIASGFFNPHTVSPTIDPSISGVHVFITDRNGTNDEVIYDMNIPGGLVGSSPCFALDGWTKTTTITGQTIWEYVNRSGVLPPSCKRQYGSGIFKVRIKSLTAIHGLAYRYVVRSHYDTLPHLPVFPVKRLQFDLTLGTQPAPSTASQQAEVGQCTESVFKGVGIGTVSQVPPKPFCRRLPLTGTLHTIMCKGR